MTRYDSEAQFRLQTAVSEPCKVPTAWPSSQATDTVSEPWFPVSLSKIGTHLPASFHIIGKIGTLLVASEMPVPISRKRNVLTTTTPWIQTAAL